MAEGVDWATIVGQIMLGLTTLGGFWYNNHRDKLKRQWDLQDREENRRLLADRMANTQEQLLTKLDQNTEVSQRAADASAKAEVVANGLNQKLLKMAERIDGVRIGQQDDRKQYAADEAERESAKARKRP